MCPAIIHDIVYTYLLRFNDYSTRGGGGKEHINWLGLGGVRRNIVECYEILRWIKLQQPQFSLFKCAAHIVQSFLTCPPLFYI